MILVCVAAAVSLQVLWTDCGLVDYRSSDTGQRRKKLVYTTPNWGPGGVHPPSSTTVKITLYNTRRLPREQIKSVHCSHSGHGARPQDARTQRNTNSHSATHAGSTKPRTPPSSACGQRPTSCPSFRPSCPFCHPARIKPRHNDHTTHANDGALADAATTGSRCNLPLRSDTVAQTFPAAACRPA